MADFALLSISYLAGAIFHAAVHVAGHEAYHGVALRIHKRVLRNHDVAKAFAESLTAALGMLQADYKARSSLSRAEWRAVKEWFRELRAAGLDLMKEAQGQHPWSEPSDMIPLADGGKADLLVQQLIETVGELPIELQRMLHSSFPQAFAFAFREIGLKRNPVVSTVLIHEILNGIKRSTLKADEALREITHALKGPVGLLERQEQLQQQSRAVTQEGFRAVLARLRALEATQQRLLSSVSSPSNQGSVRGVLTVSDKDGYRLAARLLFSGLITLGRDEANEISLPHRGISARHAQIQIAEDEKTLIDLGSKNSTILNGVRVNGRCQIHFEDEIEIGPFVIELYPPGEADKIMKRLSTFTGSFA